jgi:hypothetical protein
MFSVYAQSLTIEETIAYINNLEKQEPFKRYNDYERAWESYYLIYNLEQDGKLTYTRHSFFYNRYLKTTIYGSLYLRKPGSSLVKAQYGSSIKE